MEHRVELKFGYKDKEGNLHKEVVFGKRLTGEDLFAIDNDPQARSRTQHIDLIRRKAITKFGTLSMPVPTNILLKLNRVDRGIIAEGYEDFVRESRADKTGEFRPNNVVQLAFGFEIAGTTYTIAELNRLTDGYDEITADTLGLEGLGRICFLAARSISRLMTADEPPFVLEGPIEFEHFKKLDGDDISLIRQGVALAEVFFRIAGKEVPTEQPSEEGAASGEGDGMDGAGDLEAVEPKAG